FSISSGDTVMRLEPTGATPRMLVPVTVTDSTELASGVLWACAGKAKKAEAAASANTEPPNRNVCKRPFMRNLSPEMPPLVCSLVRRRLQAGSARPLAAASMHRLAGHASHPTIIVALGLA